MLIRFFRLYRAHPRLASSIHPFVGSLRHYLEDCYDSCTSANLSSKDICTISQRSRIIENFRNFVQHPKGLDTSLYKNLDEEGVEISGGGARKIALARTLYKDAPFIILNEPTAALDPIAEFEIYPKFNEIVGDKTAVYISHRLSPCRFCNDIAVFNQCEPVQRGDHDTLFADIDGKYHELWNAQAQYYQDKAVS